MLVGKRLYLLNFMTPKEFAVELGRRDVSEGRSVTAPRSRTAAETAPLWREGPRGPDALALFTCSCSSRGADGLETLTDRTRGRGRGRGNPPSSH